MELTREEALKYHRMMWTDMRRNLGDNPNAFARIAYKDAWIKEHFPNSEIDNDCFLCEYVNHHGHSYDCTESCPINWDGGCFSGHVNYRESPISEILALPERGEME